MRYCIYGIPFDVSTTNFKKIDSPSIFGLTLQSHPMRIKTSIEYLFHQLPFQGQQLPSAVSSGRTEPIRASAKNALAVHFQDILFLTVAVLFFELDISRSPHFFELFSFLIYLLIREGSQDFLKIFGDFILQFSMSKDKQIIVLYPS